MNPRLLVVDLNNFARYPSIAIGYLTAILRAGGYDVEILSPLSTGLTGVTREPRSRAWGRLELEFRYSAGTARYPFVRWLRTQYASRSSSKLARSKNAILSEFKASLGRGFDAVLVSTYLMYRPHCVGIAEICRDRGLPLILGGPYFAVPDVARAWIDIPGVTALIGGEVEPRLCDIVSKVVAGEPLNDMQGVWRNNGVLSIDAPPLVDLDNLPFPDYRAFPWANYPNTIVPMITGRGCGWGVCLFCSDITSTSGRTFRSRSLENVLEEMQFQHERHSTRLFVFTDLKINSNLEMWGGLIGGARRIVPGARWIGAVHVGSHGDNGLSLKELQEARAAGMVRVTTGLESGSQRVLDKMVKGTDLGATSRFLNDARAADIGVRATMIIGYPGEESRDLDETTAFLEKHEGCLERISLSRLGIKSGTQIARQIERTPLRFPGIQIESMDPGQAEIGHRYAMTDDPGYRRAISRLFHVVHRINRKALRPAGRDFEGVM